MTEYRRMQRLIADLKEVERKLDETFDAYTQSLNAAGFKSIEDMWNSGIPYSKQKPVNVLFTRYQNAKIEARRLAAETEAELQKADLKRLRRNWGAM